MGRYAFFNTKFEYKFRFGVQESSDMLSFGGEQTYESLNYGYFDHKWQEQDKYRILKELQSFCGFLTETLPDFESYEKNKNGTYNLSRDLYKLYDEIQEEEFIARFILGCCIYHQLLYKTDLEVQYEG
jgi:hypothetical protein